MRWLKGLLNHMPVDAPQYSGRLTETWVWSPWVVSDLDPDPSVVHTDLQNFLPAV